MILVIQSNIPGRLLAWFVQRDGKIAAAGRRRVAHHGSEKLLSLVDRLLRRQRLNLKKLTGLVVVRGPGPFTAVRTGLLVANTLAVSLGRPIRGVVVAEALTAEQVGCLGHSVGRRARSALVKPWYGRGPNISRPKRRRR